MDQYLTPTFIVPFFAALFFGAWWYFKGRKRKQNEKTAPVAAQGVKVLEPLSVMLYDRTTYPFTRYEAILPKEVVDKIMLKYGTLGRQLTYGTKQLVCYFKGLVKDEVVYEPVFEPTSVKDSPKELYIDTRHYYAEVTEKSKTEKGFLQKHGALLIFLFGLAFLAFMIVSNK